MTRPCPWTTREACEQADAMAWEEAWEATDGSFDAECRYGANFADRPACPEHGEGTR